MFRSAQKYNSLPSCPLAYSMEESFFDSTGDGNKMVLNTRKVSELSDLQLDPRTVTIQSLLENGISLNPSEVGDLLSEHRFDVMNRFSQEFLTEKFDQVREYVESIKQD